VTTHAAAGGEKRGIRTELMPLANRLDQVVDEIDDRRVHPAPGILIGQHGESAGISPFQIVRIRIGFDTDGAEPWESKDNAGNGLFHVLGVQPSKFIELIGRNHILFVHEVPGDRAFVLVPLQDDADILLLLVEETFVGRLDLRWRKDVRDERA
jgi:hypothetical protein